MPYSGAGVFALYTPGNPVVTGTTISSTWANNTLTDIATGLSTAVCKDGQQTITANIPFAGFKLTGLGAGTARTDAAQVAQVQNSTSRLIGTIAGTNTITGVMSPALTAYTSGQTFVFIPANTNSGATTINIDSLGAKNIFTGGVACAGGELVVGVPALIEYDGTQLNLMNVAVTTGSTATTFTFDGSGGTSASITVTWQKMGSFIQIDVPFVTAVTGTGSTVLTSNTAIAAAARPSGTRSTLCEAINNGAATTSPGAMRISSGGILTILRDPASTAYTNAGAGGLASNTSWTYFI